MGEDEEQLINEIMGYPGDPRTDWMAYKEADSATLHEVWWALDAVGTARTQIEGAVFDQTND